MKIKNTFHRVDKTARADTMLIQILGNKNYNL